MYGCEGGVEAVIDRVSFGIALVDVDVDVDVVVDRCSCCVETGGIKDKVDTLDESVGGCTATIDGVACN